jgi:cytochrome c-type biogenesis protein CcmH/NrfF
MEQYSLTLGAHLLLWGFPLTLVILVAAESLLDARRGGKRR